jgi:hypothetical protein
MAKRTTGATAEAKMPAAREAPKSRALDALVAYKEKRKLRKNI